MINGWVAECGDAGLGVDSCPGQDGGTRFHQATQYSMQFRIYEMLVYEIFHLIFSEHGWPQVTETVKAKLWIRGKYCRLLKYLRFQQTLSNNYIRMFLAFIKNMGTSEWKTKCL